MTTEQHGVAQQVMLDLAHCVTHAQASETRERCTWETTGAVLMHHELSEEAQRILTGFDQLDRENGSYDPHTRSRVVILIRRLGLDVEDGYDQ